MLLIGADRVAEAGGRKNRGARRAGDNAANDSKGRRVRGFRFRFGGANMSKNLSGRVESYKIMDGGAALSSLVWWSVGFVGFG